MSNISEQKRNELFEKIKCLREFISSSKQDKNTENLLKYITDIEKEVKIKKYGLVFEEHKEEIDEILENSIPFLNEEKDLFVDNGGNVNFLIEGDNLASLHLLEKTHREKIDVIYIDPPYNTGAKNWKYNNDYVDGNDTFRHSKWLSFMKKRLLIAKNLLSEDGVIVITIDDYEIENLTLLANEIFGEENRLATIVIKNNPSGRSTVSGVSISHEYALFYSKTQKAKLGRLPRSEKQLARYKEKDDISPYEWVNYRARYSTISPRMAYPIVIKRDCSNFRIPLVEWLEDLKEYKINEPIADDEVVVYPDDNLGNRKCWKWSIDTFNQLKSTDACARLDSNGLPAIYVKARMNQDGMLPLTVWDDTKYSSTEYGTNLLKNILGNKLFDYPKSLYAVIDTLKVANISKDSIVLDFFAGSGTTGHAVMELNREDGGNRKFILCTNNENNICREVTYERIKKVIANENYMSSLKYMKVDYLPVSEMVYYEYADDLLKHTKELLELEHAVDLDNSNKYSIVLSNEELDELVDNLSPECEVVYLSHNVLTSSNQENIFVEKGIEIRRVPDYYYKDAVV